MAPKRKSAARNTTPAKKAKASATPNLKATNTNTAHTRGRSQSSSNRAASVEDVPDEGETSNEELGLPSDTELEEPEEDAEAQLSKSLAGSSRHY